MRFAALISAAALLAPAAWSQPYTLSVISGGGGPASGLGTSALIPANRLALDAHGNLFFTTTGPAQNSVARLDAATGLLSAAAGNGTSGFGGDNGLAVNAELSHAIGVAFGPDGSLYIADSGNFRVRKVTNGVITTVAGNGTAGFGGDNGPATSAQLNPYDVAVDSAGALYIADAVNSRIRKVANGVITTVAGNGTPGFSGDGGPATAAELMAPVGVAVDSNGNLYISDSVIREVSNGLIHTVGGIPTFLSPPAQIAVDSAGNLYIADTGSGRVRELSNGVIGAVAGGGQTWDETEPAVGAYIGSPLGVAVDSGGNIFVSGSGANGLFQAIFKVSGASIAIVAGGAGLSGGLQPYIGDGGPAINAAFHQPLGMAVDAAGNLYIATTNMLYTNTVLPEFDLDDRVREISKGIVSTAAGDGNPGNIGDGGPATAARLEAPVAVATDSKGNLYIADWDAGEIREVSGGLIHTIAGSSYACCGTGDGGPAVNAGLYGPLGVAVDSEGNVYIADTSDNRIRKVSSGIITTIAGNGTGGDNGPAISAALYNPNAVAVDASGNLYVAESGGLRIRKIANGVITTVASGLNGPTGLAVDTAGNLYIADKTVLRKLSNGVMTTIAGAGIPLLNATGAAVAWPSSIWGVAVDANENIYVSDPVGGLIYQLTQGSAPAISPGGIVPNDSSVPVLQPGSWASIYGTNLAPGTFLWNGDFPTLLGGVSVTIDNRPAYLWYASFGQINLQVPDDSAIGPVSVTVTTPSGTAVSTVTLAPVAPSFSLLGDGIHVAGEISTGVGAYDLVGPSNTFSYNTRPVKPGEILTLYGVGFGPTTPHVSAGRAFSGSAPTSTPVTIKIGGVNANVLYSGMTQAGLYQINLVVPPGMGVGDQPVVATVAGVSTSAVVTIAGQ